MYWLTPKISWSSRSPGPRPDGGSQSRAGICPESGTGSSTGTDTSVGAVMSSPAARVIPRGYAAEGVPRRTLPAGGPASRDLRATDRLIPAGDLQAPLVRRDESAEPGGGTEGILLLQVSGIGPQVPKLAQSLADPVDKPRVQG